MSNTDWYRRVEKLLFMYPENVKHGQELALSLWELEEFGDVKVQQYGMSSFGGDVTDRVLSYVHKKQVFERLLARIKRNVDAIEFACDRLAAMKTEKSRLLLTVMNAVYFNPNPDLLKNAGLNESQVKRLRHELVKRVRRYIYRYNRLLRRRAARQGTGKGK